MRAKSWYLLVMSILILGLANCSGRKEAVGSELVLKGVVIEEVGEGSALEKAGLRPGDVVRAWERPPNPPANPDADQGEIESVFDWMWLKVEQAPRGMVKLFGERAGVKRFFEVEMGRWTGRVRPSLSDLALEAYLQGRKEIRTGEIQQGVEIWNQLSQLGEAKGHLGSWIQLCIGEEFAEQRAWEKALSWYLAAMESGGTRAEVAIRDLIGNLYEHWRLWDHAEANYQSALRVAEATWKGSLHAAKIQYRLGGVAYLRGQFERASSYYRDALEIQNKLAPNSVASAKSLGNLGLLAVNHGQLELASEYFQSGLEIQEKLTPDSLDLAKSLGNLRTVARFRGQLDLASEYFQRALEIQEKLTPDNLDMAKSLGNLGLLARTRGQLDLASEYHQRALKIQKRQCPDGLELAKSLNHLGTVALYRGQLDLASEYYQRALEIQERQAPDSLDLATSLVNLGNLAHERGQLDLASEYYQRALEIQERLAPDSLGLAVILNGLGFVVHERGQLDLASEYFQRAFEIQERPSAYHQHPLEIYEKLAPDSLDLIESISYLGETARDRGDIGRAADFFRLAINTFEAQISSRRFSHGVTSSIRARHGEYYRDAIESLLQLHRPKAAFAMLESSRGRDFLALLTERDLIFSDVPEDLDRERRRLAVLYDRTQEQLKGLNLRDHGEQIGQLMRQLRELRRQHDANTEEIRRASPTFAALRYPEPLDFEGVRQTLDPATVMLSYSVGKEQVDLFVLTREDPLRVHTLEIGEEILQSQMKKFENHVGSDRYALGNFEMAKWFYRKLVEPASETIKKSGRILLVPDGPLHRLPFAALIRDLATEQEGDMGRNWQYLVEWKPIHTVLSGTVYAELRKLRRPSPKGTSSVALAAFGDPDYSQAYAEGGNRDAIENVYVRAVSERREFKPLPYTRTEVETVAGLFGSQPVRTYLGKEATEERAKALGKDVRIVHFATHGDLNDQFPLNTALALTIPKEFSAGRENGLLQVWEIFERVRLDADLVVLSACETAAGQEQFGEGLIGLSRAFQYSGARSVLATLWSVPDRATAELMIRFYRYLRSGKAFDESLRAAQIELIRGEVKTSLGRPASEPFYWAAFQVIGDWK